MYEKLEGQYKLNSYIKKYRIFVFTFIVFFIICFILFTKYVLAYMSDFSVFLSIISFFLSYFFIFYVIQCLFLILKKKITKKNRTCIFNPFECFDLLFDFLYDMDMEFLFNFLAKNKITEKEQIKMIIYHYNSKIPKKTNSSSGLFFSLAALLFSGFSYASNDGVHLNEKKLQFLFFVFTISIMFYYTPLGLIKIYDVFFSKYEMYKRIEKGLSDIYFNYEDYRERYLKKILLIQNKNYVTNLDNIKSVYYNVNVINFDEVKIDKINEYFLVLILKFSSSDKKTSLYFELSDNDYVNGSKIDKEEVKSLVGGKIKIITSLKNKKINDLYKNVLAKNSNSLE